MTEGVFLPPETWMHILSYCDRDWSAHEDRRYPNGSGSQVVALPAQAAAACVCKAWACGIARLPRRLHLRVSCIDDHSKKKLIQVVSLSMCNSLVPYFVPSAGVRVTATVPSVRQGKNLVRTCASSVLKRLAIFSGGDGPGAPGVAMTGELQEIARKMPPNSKILLHHMAWPPTGNHLMCLPYSHIKLGKEEVWRIVLKRIRLYGSNVWERIQKKIPRYSESISLTEVLNITLKCIGLTHGCACLGPLSIPYWDVRPFEIGRLTYYVPASSNSLLLDKEKIVCILPRVDTPVTLTAGSSYAIKARFTQHCRFVTVAKAHLPPGYMRFEDVRHVRLAHIEVRNFDVFRRVFPNVETVEMGTRVAYQVHLEDIIRTTSGISLKTQE